MMKSVDPVDVLERFISLLKESQTREEFDKCVKRNYAYVMRQIRKCGLTQYQFDNQIRILRDESFSVKSLDDDIIL